MSSPPTHKKMRITVDGRTYEVLVEVQDDGTEVQPTPPPPAQRPPLVPPPPQPVPVRDTTSGALYSPLAGTVVAVHVLEGQSVEAGTVVLTLEAMKMNLPVRAPRAGTVMTLKVASGETVGEGQVLAVLA